jgi:hypothetical protein
MDLMSLLLLLVRASHLMWRPRLVRGLPAEQQQVLQQSAVRLQRLLGVMSQQRVLMQRWRRFAMMWCSRHWIASCRQHPADHVVVCLVRERLSLLYLQAPVQF